MKKTEDFFKDLANHFIAKYGVKESYRLTSDVGFPLGHLLVLRSYEAQPTWCQLCLVLKDNEIKLISEKPEMNCERINGVIISAITVIFGNKNSIMVRAPDYCTGVNGTQFSSGDVFINSIRTEFITTISRLIELGGYSFER